MTTATARKPRTKRAPKVWTPKAPTHDRVDLTSYDKIVVSTSGGKDSVVTLWRVVRMAIEQGVLDRVVVVHADLGRVEWEGTQEIAKAQADHFGVPFVVVSRIGDICEKTSNIYRKGEAYGDMLDYAIRRGEWYSMGCRYCTSEFKRAPINKFYTRLTNEWRAAKGLNPAGLKGGPCRILDVQGLRSQESPRRDKMQQLAVRKSNARQHVDTWLPVKEWTHDEIWHVINREALPMHPAYSYGMKRLSCAFCVFAGRDSLVCAAAHNRKLLDLHCEIEEQIGDFITWPKSSAVSLREVRAAVDAGERCDNASDFQMD
jgi:3'-phosphoadenosine 5'-phosphosulfate sulfotransferase (PAPS reductase)/FAD synthetase